MKKIISAIAILAIVSGSLAFKAKTFGSVYCNSTCTNKVDFRIEPTGAELDPCDNSSTPQHSGEFVLSTDNSCVEVATGTHYIAVGAGK